MGCPLQAGIACVRVQYKYLRGQRRGCVFRSAGECGYTVLYCKRGNDLGFLSGPREGWIYNAIHPTISEIQFVSFWSRTAYQA